MQQEHPWSPALTAALLAVSAGKQVRPEAASMPSRGSETSVAEGGEGKGRGGSAVQGRQQGTDQIHTPAHGQPTLESLGRGLSLRGIEGNGQTSKTWLYPQQNQKGFLFNKDDIT